MAETQMDLFSGQGTPLSFKSIKKVLKALRDLKLKSWLGISEMPPIKVRKDEAAAS